MQTRDIIVIGASAGGFEAIRRLVAGLPADLPASLFIVWHMSPDIRGILPQILNRLNGLPAAHAIDKERIERSRIYVAPPDHHLLIEKDQVRITRGPKENRFRPAVDPLFRSAAYTYGSRVIGVILSGALDDGSAGLWTIKWYNGVAVVQDPEDAEVPSMPQNALETVDVDYKVAVSEMPELLIKLTGEQAPLLSRESSKEDELTKTEIGIAEENGTLKKKIMELGELSPYTCPECHGVLTAIKEGKRLRFRCHTGHAFSADSLLASITESIEENLWSAIRSVQESIILLNHMGDHFAEMNRPKLAAIYFRKAKEAEMRTQIVRKAVLAHEQLSSDGIQEEAERPGTGE
jgi:two-component system chemotaxis response regulator CheB